MFITPSYFISVYRSSWWKVKGDCCSKEQLNSVGVPGKQVKKKINWPWYGVYIKLGKNQVIRSDREKINQLEATGFYKIDKMKMEKEVHILVSPKEKFQKESKKYMFRKICHWLELIKHLF